MCNNCLHKTITSVFCRTARSIVTTALMLGVVLFMGFGIAHINSIFAAEGINQTFNLEGKLVKTDGTNVDDTCVSAGKCDFRVRIYDASTLGSLLWEEVHSNIAVVDGIFNLKVGSVTSLSDTDLQNFNRDDLWIEIEYDPSGDLDFAEGEVFTRSRLAAVPYAMNTAYLGGISKDGYLQIDPLTAQTATGTGPSIFLNKTGATGAIAYFQKNGTTVVTIDNDGNLGLGVADPIPYKLQVNGTVAPGVDGQSMGVSALRWEYWGSRIDLYSTSTSAIANIVYNSAVTVPTALTISNSGVGAITTALDLSDAEIVNAVNLGQNSIVMDDSGTVDWNNNSGVNLIRVTDVSKTFGASADAGAFIDRNSTYQQEFSTVRPARNSDISGGGTANGMGDGMGWGTYESSNCTFTNPPDVINGVLRITSVTTNNGCLSMIDESLRNPHTVLNVANIPVILMKVSPSATPSASNITFVGMGNATDGATTDPQDFIGFTNNSGTTWTGVTRVAGVSTTVACTGQTISTSQFALLKVETVSSTEVRFWVDNDVSDGINWFACGSSTTNIPSISLVPQLIYQARTGGTANSYLDVDFYRYWQDDAPSSPIIASNNSAPSSPIIASNNTVSNTESNPENTSTDDNIQNQELTDLITLDEIFVSDEVANLSDIQTLITTQNQFLSDEITNLSARIDALEKQLTDLTVGNICTVDSTSSDCTMIEDVFAELEGGSPEGTDALAGQQDLDSENGLVAGTSTSSEDSAENADSTVNNGNATESGDPDNNSSDSENTQTSTIIEPLQYTTIEEAIDKLNTKIETLKSSLNSTLDGVFDSADTQAILSLLSSAKQVSLNTLEIKGDMTIGGLLVINSDLVVKGDIKLNANYAGVVEAPTGSKVIEVKFAKAFDSVPIINVSPVAKDSTITQVLDTGFKYVVGNITESGFKIYLSQEAVTGLGFSWSITVIDR